MPENKWYRIETLRVNELWFIWFFCAYFFILVLHTFPFWSSLFPDPLNPICEDQTSEREAKIPKSQLSEAQNFVPLWENLISDFIIRFVYHFIIL